MKFTLVYDGRLDSQNSSGVFSKKWEIRQYLAPQLEELWRVHDGLKKLNPYVPKGGNFFNLESYHEEKYDPEPYVRQVERVAMAPDKWIHLLAPIDVRGVQFLPMVRNSLALSCALKILFLRKENPGHVYTGDLDNRIKTFLDALKVPNSEADCVEKIFPKPTEPIRCLLEDDGLITALNVETARLLSSDQGEKNYVRLVVEVDVQVNYPRTYNQLFLGD